MIKLKKEKINFATSIWLFTIGGFFGYILETIWHFLKHGVFINKQGLIYGPFKPIYGFGLLIIIICMQPFKDKKLLPKFIIGTLIGSAFEYFGSLFQELFFKTTTWNYSSFHFNIGGRIYLPYCLAWGIIAVLTIDYLFPYLKKIALNIPLKLKKAATILLSIFMIFNVSITTLATIRYSERARNIKANNELFKLIDKLYPDKYMNNKFPKLKVIKKD